MIYKKSSKAQNLNILRRHKFNFFVPKFYYIEKKILKKESKVIKDILKNFKNKIIIRSSSLNEDNLKKSNAGKYLSLGNISLNYKSISNALEKVGKKLKQNDQIIVQDFIDNVDLSGVIFTRDPNNNSPYYIINYDRSRKTDLITSGNINPTLETKIIYRNKVFDTKFNKLIKVVKKIEGIFKSDTLDIEFAIKKNKIYIFQCRELVIKERKNYDKEIETALKNLEKKIDKLKKPNPFISGKTTYFSNMSDWNPAEMIGSKPKNLSISLYSELITNNIWAEQRKGYGYKDVIPNPLMVNFAGSPYIDLRTDFNSFLPAGLDKKKENKIVNNSLYKIKKKPELHDKIEFECIENSYDFNSKVIKADYLDKNYLLKLKKITEDCIKNSSKINKELNSLSQLDIKINIIKNSKLSDIQKIYYLIHNCKYYGTLPFAGIARLAFIATRFLRSMLNLKLINQNEYEMFYQYSDSISNIIKKDLIKLKNKKITKQKFLFKYGHLRPQTYSITSKNYREAFNKYFSLSDEIKIIKNKKLFFRKKLFDKIDKQIKKHNLKFSNKELVSFIIKSIHYREYSKFIFSKSIDEIFNNIKKLSKEMKLTLEDIEYVSINTFLENLGTLSPQRLKNILSNQIKENKKNFQILEKLKLPDIIFNNKNIYNFSYKIVKGNYVTNKKTSGKLLSLKNIKNIKNIKNKIILIENADPGFDYIFSYKIAGLITKYGGSNSHMSIRCLELGIPAVIGIGEKNFESLLNSNNVYLDCKQKIFRITN